MNKSELIATVVTKTGYTKKAVQEVLDSLIETTEKTVSKGEDVVLVGFGTFKKASRKARKGVNPQTGKEIKIAARKVPIFRPGAAFKDAVSKVKK